MPHVVGVPDLSMSYLCPWLGFYASAAAACEISLTATQDGSKGFGTRYFRLPMGCAARYQRARPGTSHHTLHCRAMGYSNTRYDIACFKLFPKGSGA
jgi:hypothetical protein